MEDQYHREWKEIDRLSQKEFYYKWKGLDDRLFIKKLCERFSVNLSGEKYPTVLHKVISGSHPRVRKSYCTIRYMLHNGPLDKIASLALTCRLYNSRNQLDPDTSEMYRKRAEYEVNVEREKPWYKRPHILAWITILLIIGMELLR